MAQNNDNVAKDTIANNETTDDNIIISASYTSYDINISMSTTGVISAATNYSIATLVIGGKCLSTKNSTGCSNGQCVTLVLGTIFW